MPHCSRGVGKSIFSPATGRYSPGGYSPENQDN